MTMSGAEGGNTISGFSTLKTTTSREVGKMQNRLMRI